MNIKYQIVDEFTIMFIQHIQSNNIFIILQLMLKL